MLVGKYVYVNMQALCRRNAQSRRLNNQNANLASVDTPTNANAWIHMYTHT